MRWPRIVKEEGEVAEAPLLTDRALRRQLRDNPCNLVFGDEERLIKFCEDRGVFASLRAQAIAELTIRWFVSKGRANGLNDAVARFVPESVFGRLVALRTDPIPSLLDVTTSLADCNGEEAIVERAIRHRLNLLLNHTDGFIPVYVRGRKEAFFLPFELLDGDGGGIFYDDGETPVEGWAWAAEHALDPKCRRRCRCVVRVQKDLGIPELGENSLMLPLRIANERKFGNLFEGVAFAPWRVLATGAFDAAGRLQPVQTVEKSAARARQFPDSVFLCAASDVYNEESGLILLPENACFDDLTQRIRRAVEQKGVAQLSMRYVRNRLPEVAECVRHNTFSRWHDKIDWLKWLIESVPEERNPEVALTYRMLLAETYCHSGMTAESMAVNQAAQALARRFGLVAQELRLQIETMVNLQDAGMVREGLVLAEKLASALAVFDGPEKTNLSMRFNGSLGQLLAESSLLGLDGRDVADDRKKSLLAFEEARRCAWAIADGSDKTEPERDVAQDLNYVGLWYALFQQDGPDADAAFKDAKHHIDKNLKNFKDTQEKNRHHLTRIEALRLYHRWRNSGMIGDFHSCDFTSGKVEDWIVAVWARCIGAVSAASGDGVRALEVFKRGDEALPLKACEGRGNVILGIRLTLLVQAWASLAAIGDFEHAKYFKESASEMQKQHADLCKRANFCDWTMVLAGLPDPRRLPATYY